MSGHLKYSDVITIMNIIITMNMSGHFKYRDVITVMNNIITTTISWHWRTPKAAVWWMFCMCPCLQPSPRVGTSWRFTPSGGNLGRSAQHISYGIAYQSWHISYGILVMAYWSWHSSYGILVMARRAIASLGRCLSACRYGMPEHMLQLDTWLPNMLCHN